jgi:DNA-binding MarR family transcriptional regulator
MSAVSTSPPVTPPAPLATDLCWLLTRASQLLNGELTSALEASGISPREHALLAMARTGSHTQTELARAVGLDKTTLMVTLDELEREGLVERRPLPSDRRARVIAVTEVGERSLDAAEEVLGRVRDQVLGLLPADQRDSFLQSLGRLACTDGVHQACTHACASLADAS